MFSIFGIFIILSMKKVSHTKAHSEPCQTSKMERFGKIVKGFQALTVSAKYFMLDV